ncbi:putative aldouronate transport system substrate-binding protein [Nonomuraea solani]|uniref:Putative aldouronate transport system substrate-binding protein n=1 Tax=Nonomuraea solani TaxID=1144553 RepID=A0A1H6ENM3_9ACTN|nr:extracellular solute-binding protein [Nonomuraea solani]SEG99480.1 putative aldouronate transport system substrate-binding protein [Nonomuraea solani]
MPDSTTRRGFLGLVGASVLVAGCAEKKTVSKGTAVAADKLKNLVPTRIPFDIPGLKPDLPGSEFVAPGFLTRPATMVQAVTTKPLTSGKEVTAMTPLWGTVPPGLGSNSYYDTVNERLGGTVRFNISDGNTYGQKLSTLLASGDVPEMVMVPNWELIKIAHFTEAANKLFADLSPYLAGDKAKEFPLLANYDTAAWQYGVFGGVLQGIPWQNDPFPFATFVRQDILQEMGLQHPKAGDDLIALGKAITDPKKKRWAFGGALEQEMQRAFGAPREWRKKSDGTLEYKYESAEFAASVEFMTKLFDAGYVHPDVVANKDADNKAIFGSGEMVIYRDGLGAWHEALGRFQADNPKFDMQIVDPYPAHAGGTPIMWRNEPASMFVFIKKGLGDARTRELLALSNWASAPFGTQEYELVFNGVEGAHYKVENGNIKQTALGRKEVAPTYMFLSGRPNANEKSQYKGLVQSLWDWSTKASKLLENDPFVGIRVETPSKMAGLVTPTEDKMQEIFRGKRPVSEWPKIVKEWQAQGGNEAREFYMKVARENGRL